MNKKALPYLFILSISLIFLSPLFLHNLVPIPLDILVGHYFPWKDHVWLGRVAGIPIRNFQIYDVIKQLYPWRHLSIESMKHGTLALWNPYVFMGTPHSGNMPAATFYPLNAVFFALPFLSAWVTYISVQPILSASFMYIYLKNKKLSVVSSLFGATVFAFCSFMMTRYEFGITGHTLMWLPLILLSIDKIFDSKQKRWFFVGLASTAFMFLAGYFQGMLYAGIIISAYTIYLYFERRKAKPVVATFFMLLLAFGIAAVGLAPFLAVITKSSRFGADTGFVMNIYQNFTLNLGQLPIIIAPDFFGNPATGNYIFSTAYTEYALYAGIIPAALVLYTLLFRRNKYTRFWQVVLFVSFIFLIKNPLARLPFALKLPAISSLLPSRLNMAVDFCIAVLSAFALEDFLKNGKKKYLKFVLSFSLVVLSIITLWLYAYFTHLPVAMRNLILPTVYIGISFLATLLLVKVRVKRYIVLVASIFLLITSFDLLRQGMKYNSYSSARILYPDVEALSIMQNSNYPARYMISQNELIPSDTNIMYGLSTINGYDSVHSGEAERLIGLVDTGDPSTKVPTERNLEPHNYHSPLINLLGVEYVLTKEEETDIPGMSLIYENGFTRVYKNTNAYPRVYLTKNIKIVSDSDVLGEVLAVSKKNERAAVSSEKISLSQKPLVNSSANIVSYDPNRVEVETSSDADSLLVLTETYDPSWHTYVDGIEKRLYKVDYALRGVVVPEGKHEIVFEYKPKSYYVGVIVSIISLVISIILALYFYLKK